MLPRSRLLGFVAVFVVAPLLAAVIITVLLLFGVTPHTVFLPGHLVLGGLHSMGVKAPNFVGVVTTEVFWWGVVLGGWLLLRRLRRAPRMAA